jgi:hypothetical protein
MAQRNKVKIRDLGRKKSKTEITKRAKATREKGNVRFYNDLRLKEKAANERMRQLEKRGLNSPAYQSVQAQLEILGQRTKGNRGRRFSETGKATYSERELLNKILDTFLYEQETSTVKGAKEYEREVWDTANKNNKLSEAGITRADWLEFWKNMPDKKDRVYGSSHIVAIVRAYSMKNNKLEDEDKMSVEEIAEEIKNSKNLKSAYRALGLNSDEVSNARIKRIKK